MVLARKSAEVSVMVSQCSMRWYNIVHTSFEITLGKPQLSGGLDDRLRLTADKPQYRIKLFARSQRPTGRLEESLESILRKWMKPEVVHIPAE
jgi:hypothetical protein